MDFSLPLQQSSFYRNANFLNFFIRSLTTSEQTEAALDRLISATINFSLSLSLSTTRRLVIKSSWKNIINSPVGSKSKPQQSSFFIQRFAFVELFRKDIDLDIDLETLRLWVTF